jgi:predicted metal-dependent peptidase
MTDKLSSEQIIYRAGMRLSGIPETQNFIPLYLSLNKSIVEDGINTMATNGREILFNRKFVENNSVEQVCYGILHELLHVIFHHTFPIKNEKGDDEFIPSFNLTVRGVAEEILIASVLENLTEKLSGQIDCSIPEMVDVYKQICPEVFPYLGQNVNDIVELLRKNIPQARENLRKFSKELGEHCKNHQNCPENSDETEEKEKFKPENFEEKSEQKDSQKIKDAIGHSLKSPVFQEFINRPIKEENLLSVLKRFVKKNSGSSEYTFKKINRRKNNQKIIFPSQYSETLKDFVIVVDTSGSISEKVSEEIAGIIKFIQENFPNLKGKFYAFNDTCEFVGNITKDFKVPIFISDGGTNPKSCKKIIKENKGKLFQFSITFTDGYGEGFQKLGKENLFVITEDGTTKYLPNFGKVVFI